MGIGRALAAHHTHKCRAGRRKPAGASTSWSIRYTWFLRRIACFYHLALLIVAPAVSEAQSASETRKQASAVRIAADSIRVDGRLDEDAWRRIPAVTDFVQKE